jgi:hypothetical protein
MQHKVITLSARTSVQRVVGLDKKGTPESRQPAEAQGLAGKGRKTGSHRQALPKGRQQHVRQQRQSIFMAGT